MAIDSVQSQSAALYALFKARPVWTQPHATTGGKSTAATGEAANPDAAGRPPLVGTRPLLSGSDAMLLQKREVSDENRRAYEHLLTQFEAARAQGVEPVEFVGQLSDKGLDLLKEAQSFPASMQVDLEGMTREEATNFVLPFSRQVDLDNDGFVESANGAKGFRFPPVNAPQPVKDAWAEATQGLSEKDRFLFQGLFLPVMVQGNVARDSAGNFSGILGPDDPGYTNPFTRPDFSYSRLVDDMLGSLEAFKAYESNESYEWKKEMLTGFADALDDAGVA